MAQKYWLAAVLMVLLRVEGHGADFHGGGTGDCQGCHTEPPALRGSDASSTCLNCHQAPFGVVIPTGHYVASGDLAIGAATPCRQLPPGGDFCWLKKDYRWRENSVQAESRGERHGHNIVAVDFGYGADTRHQVAPGGTFAASELSCVSCHDPHGDFRRLGDGSIVDEGAPIISSGSYSSSPIPGPGQAVGSYRLLAGKGYLADDVLFSADPPAAVAPDAYNRPETAWDTRVAYGEGMSEWCGNCHGRITNSHPGGHPAGKGDGRLTAEIIDNYNRYLFSGNHEGRAASAYNSLVPFEEGHGDYQQLKRAADSSGRNRRGPESGAVVMCLTCHRAHASAWDGAGRWNEGVVFLVYDGVFPGSDNSLAELAQGRTEAETRAGLYGRQPEAFARYQRSLCNKCHVRD